MPDSNESTSPFSILLAETGSAAAPARHSARPLGSAASQRSDAQRNQVQRGDAAPPRRPDQDRDSDAPEAASTEAASTEQAAATEQPDGALADPFEIAAAEQAEAIPELSAQPAASTGDATDGAVVAIDAALAALVETPPSPPQPVVPDAPSLAVAATPAAVAATEPGTVESVAAAGVTAAAPAGAITAVAPDAVGAATEPALPQVPQAAATPQPAPTLQTPQAPQAPEQTARPAAAPAIPQPKPPSVEPTATPESASQPQPSTTPDTGTPVAPVAGAEHAETNSVSQKPVHAETPSHPPAQADGPEAAERPQAASAVSEFVQAAHPTPDSSHLAHLQTGRDFGQAVAATAQVSQGADASDPLASAPVPLESLAVEIATRAQAGRNRFEIRLDPPELGRIDVRLDIDRSGNVTSRLVVDKAETLDVLRRDAHQLERALQDAGLKTSDNGLQFSLRDQSSADRNDRSDSNNPRVLVADPELAATEAAPAAYGLTLRGGGIDIRV